MDMDTLDDTNSVLVNVAIRVSDVETVDDALDQLAESLDYANSHIRGVTVELVGY